MSERLRSLARIVALQAERKRLAEWNLVALDRRRAEIETARSDLDGFMADGNLAGPLATAALNQARRLAERAAGATQDRGRLVAILQTAERRHALAERIASTAAAEERGIAERRTLEEIIEGVLRRDG